MEIAVLSDTHVPGQAEAIPESFRERIVAADHTIHAGDFGSYAAHEAIRDAAGELTAVFGNADPNDIDLPRVAAVELGGLTFVVVHGIVDLVERAVSSSEGVVTSDEDWRDAVATVARARAGTDGVVGVGGHSHTVVDTTHEGVRLLNPGSATGVGPADRPTMLTVQVLDGRTSVTVNEV